MHGTIRTGDHMADMALFRAVQPGRELNSLTYGRGAESFSSAGVKGEITKNVSKLQVLKRPDRNTSVQRKCAAFSEERKCGLHSLAMCKRLTLDQSTIAWDLTRPIALFKSMQEIASNLGVVVKDLGHDQDVDFHLVCLSRGSRRLQRQ